MFKKTSVKSSKSSHPKKWVIIFSIMVAVMITLFASVLFAQRRGGRDQRGGSSYPEKISLSSEELPIPPLMESTLIDGERVFDFAAKESKHTFASGLTSQTLSYSPASYLGPTIRVKEGEKVRFNVKNNLREGTTVHWHGVHLPAEMDGNMHQPIEPGESWSPHYTIDQPAGTFWYHPHYYHLTAEQAYMGLAGFYLIDDEEESTLPLPRTYGEDDIPLVLQDRTFDNKGELIYRQSMHTEMMGALGDVIIANGLEQPNFIVKDRLVRFRLLNGSNSSVYSLRFSNGLPFQIIAGDAGLLESPVERKQLDISPGERFEIVVDFSKTEIGDIFSLDLLTHYGLETRAMTLKVDSLNDRGTSVPSRLVAVEEIEIPSNVYVRKFLMETFSNGSRKRLTINGKNMDMNRIDERVPLGSTEIWEVSSEGGGMMGGLLHNFHLHDTSFQILTIDGVAPPPEFASWKDTVLIPNKTTVRFAVKFENYTGIYMYHCHFLEHEDYGMMGQFEVY